MSFSVKKENTGSNSSENKFTMKLEEDKKKYCTFLVKQ